MSEPEGQPRIVIIGGPSGAGKTTASRQLLVGELTVETFVNADELARHILPGDPGSAAIAAGRAMLTRLDEPRRTRVSMAIETTMSGRSLAVWLRDAFADGHRVHVIYLWLSGPDAAVRRVAERVSHGGHHIPDDVVRRR